MEYNSRDIYTSLIISPSYLVDLSVLPKFIDFQNPLRKTDELVDGDDGDGNVSYHITFDDLNKDDGNWFKTAYYAIANDYLGARAGLNEAKNVLVVDKRQNRLYGFESNTYYGGAESGGLLCGQCNENNFRAINDTLFEFKTTSALDLTFLALNEGPYYHYLHIINGSLVALPNTRIFSFTKYVKMDDSYLQGCYIVNNNKTTKLSAEMLQYMKNEIYDSYGYKFKTARWTEAFDQRYIGRDHGVNANVNDSLTTIDKYNINWINNKLKQLQKPGVNTLAAQ